MNISDKIYKLRQEKGWSQDELAEKLTVSRQSVSKWESGKSVPDSDKIVLLSELFSVSADYLLKDSGEAAAEPRQAEEPTAVDKDGTFDTKPLPIIIEAAEIPTAAPPIVPPAIQDGNAPTGSPDGAAAPQQPAGKPRRKLGKKLTAVIVAVCVILAALIPYPFGLYSKALDLIMEEPVQYPYVLVHGLGGWGPESGINDMVPYWGASTGNLREYLAGEGYAVFEASVGPFSSTWDRACELYAQLTGTKVDYGEAHAEANGHSRYGRTYNKPLFEGWGTKTQGGQTVKINLVGHSYGGPTIRLLASLLANGADEEVAKSGDSVSSLFKGGKGDWINSVTALCSPNNGSTLFLILDKYKLTDTILDFCLAFAGITGNTAANGFLDFHLEQFGITQAPGEETDIAGMKDALRRVFETGTDNAAFDVSPDNAAEMNKRIGLVDGVAYFSFAYSTTKEGALTGNQVPESDTLLILYPLALMIGSYTEDTSAAYQIDKTWQPNDGLVNVVSAQYPLGDEWKAFDKENIERGKWNVMPIRNGDHGTVIGLNAGAEATRTFYTDHFTMIDSLPRDKKYYFKSPF